MAYIDVTSTVHTAVRIYIRSLQEPGRNYDKFRFVFGQNGVVLLNYDVDGWGSGTTINYTFDNPDYLGNNFFAPMTTYSVYVEAYYNGVAYPVYGSDGNPVVYTTDNILPPTVEKAPTIYPTMRNQGQGTAGNTCVACALTAAMELTHAQAMGSGSSYENYSIPYFYGTDTARRAGMDVFSAVQTAVNVGSPRWELVEPSFSFRANKSSAQSLYQNAVFLAHSNAGLQRYSGYTNIDFYDCASVQNAIASNGFFLFSFAVPRNFNSIPSSGIVPQPDSWSGAIHTILLIGITNIGGKMYWIGQNSWGTGWGKNGLCYIPYDWGCGVTSWLPQGSVCDETNWGSYAMGWTVECYELYDTSVAINHPKIPNVDAAGWNADRTAVTITYTNGTGGDGVLVYAREVGTDNWWPKTGDPNNPSRYGVEFYGGTGTIYFDDSTKQYEITLISVRDSNSILSLRSGVYTLDVTTNCYVYDGTDWKPATPYIYDSGWNPATGHIYDGGWNP